MKNLETFMSLYVAALTEAVEKYPAEYSWPVANVPIVADRMKAAFVSGGYNKEGRAIKAVCKKLGIKHTYTAINEYLKGGE